MFNSRNYLIGLGTGFIIISIILMSLNVIIEVKNTDDNKDLSVSELKTIAVNQGYNLYTNEEIANLTANFQENKVNDNMNKEIEAIYFSIPEGMPSLEVAEYLQEIKIIINKEAFLELLNKNNLTKKIKKGVYIYKKPMSTEDVIELITRTKITE